MGGPVLNLRNTSVAIVGLGLMGGSLALALKEREVARHIIGSDVNREAREAAAARGAVDEASEELTALGGADIVVLATPVRTILRLLPRIGESARAGALILDLGSTKAKIVQAMNGLPQTLCAVGGHPMCGKETHGFEAAEASLFQDRTFVLTPTARTTDQALATATALTESVGARPLVLDAARHDELVAAISHLPFAVAATLVSTVEDWGAGDERLRQLAASGYRDTTRLAASETEMMLDILLTNNQNIAGLMRRYARAFAELADWIENEAEQELRLRLAAAAQARRGLK